MMKPYLVISLSLTVFAVLHLTAVSASRSPRIIGGYNATAGQFPFLAAIHVTTSNSQHFCGGALLSTEWILTAAQCVDNAVTLTIQLGSHKLTEDDPDRVIVATSEYVIHPDYNPSTLDSDIALVKLRMPVELSDYLKPVYALPAADIPEGWLVLSIGWGQIEDDVPTLNEDLQFARLNSLTNDECRITYGNQITDNMLCAAGSYNEGICIGDTGSPLVYLLKFGNPVPYGVASFMSGNGCETPDPSGYTRVYPFNPWITNLTGVTNA